MSQSSRLYFLPQENQRSICLKTQEGGFWGNQIEDVDEEDNFNVSRTPLQPQLRDFLYITTLSGFERGSHIPKQPILGIILPKRNINLLSMDNILGFVMHDVEDIRDYNLVPHRNIPITSRRNFRNQVNENLRLSQISGNIVKFETHSQRDKNGDGLVRRLKRNSFDLPLTQSFLISNDIGLNDVIMNAEYVPHQEAVKSFLSDRGYSFDSFFSVVSYR